MSDNTAQTLRKLAEAMRDEQYFLPLGAIDYVEKAADEIDRLRIQETERKSELDNIHDTILPRLTEEIRKLRDERNNYRATIEEARNMCYPNHSNGSHTFHDIGHFLYSALKGASK